jgi:ankyrin repeat protein
VNRRLITALLSLVLIAGVVFAQTIPPLTAETTPLHWAAENGLVDIAEGLLENGALVDAVDPFGRTPLHVSVRHPAMVAFLIRSGADVNVADIFGRTPLHEALTYSESVVLLIDSGADVFAEDFMGHTPLERTLSYGTLSRNLTVIQLLIGAGAGAPDG